MLRIGHGFDVHAFGGDKPLILGGVEFAGHQGLLAHSDGDVVLHAVCDALLGASALGDIGRHFPDNDVKFAGIDSRELLAQVAQLITQQQCSINNIDVTIVAQTPKIAPNITAICANIAQDLQLKTQQVNVKATTTESLGYIGRKEGIAVHAVCMVEMV